MYACMHILELLHLRNITLIYTNLTVFQLSYDYFINFRTLYIYIRSITIKMN